MAEPIDIERPADNLVALLSYMEFLETHFDDPKVTLSYATMIVREAAGHAVAVQGKHLRLLESQMLKAKGAT